MSSLRPVIRELDAAVGPVPLFFRDDDGGWADDRLLALLDVFAAHGVPLDVAVIPAALGPSLAAQLRAHRETAPDLLRLHQHGYAHVNHEPEGRRYEFGPSRSAHQQRRDIEAGAERLRELLGDAVAPIFTPPWNRCTETTGRCLLELGFEVLARDSTAAPLGLDGLTEVRVRVDWCKPDRVARLAAAIRGGGPVGVMLHHATEDAAGLAAIGELLGVFTAHPNAECLPLLAGVRHRRRARPTPPSPKPVSDTVRS